MTLDATTRQLLRKRIDAALRARNQRSCSWCTGQLDGRSDKHFCSDRCRVYSWRSSQKQVAA